MKSRNAKFSENDLMSKSNQFKNIVFKKDHSESQPSTSSYLLVIVNNIVQVYKMGFLRLIVEVQQADNNISVDQVVQALLRISE